MYGSLCRRNVPGEPEGTRGTSRTRTRGPDRSFNDDLVDIQVLHDVLDQTSQSGGAEFIHSYVFTVKSRNGAKFLISAPIGWLVIAWL